MVPPCCLPRHISHFTFQGPSVHPSPPVLPHRRLNGRETALHVIQTAHNPTQLPTNSLNPALHCATSPLQQDRANTCSQQIPQPSPTCHHTQLPHNNLLLPTSSHCHDYSNSPSHRCTTLGAPRTCIRRPLTPREIVSNQRPAIATFFIRHDIDQTQLVDDIASIDCETTQQHGTGSQSSQHNSPLPEWMPQTPRQRRNKDDRDNENAAITRQPHAWEQAEKTRKRSRWDLIHPNSMLTNLSRAQSRTPRASPASTERRAAAQHTNRALDQDIRQSTKRNPRIGRSGDPGIQRRGGAKSASPRGRMGKEKGGAERGRGQLNGTCDGGRSDAQSCEGGGRRVELRGAWVRSRIQSKRKEGR